MKYGTHEKEATDYADQAQVNLDKSLLNGK